MRRRVFLLGGLWTGLTGAQTVRAAHQWAEERQFGPFLVRSEFPLRDVRQLVQDVVDQRSEVEETLGLTCEEKEIQIHLFSSRSSYSQYVGKRIPEGARRQALFVPGNDALRIYAYRQKALETDVRHESTHAILHSALPYVPIWLDEGLAEYFEVPATLRKNHNPHRSEIQTAIRWRRWRPDIETLESKRKMMDMSAADYRDSWGIVHFLLHGPAAAKDALSEYFEEVQSGARPKPVSRHLRDRFANLDQLILDHLR